MGLFDYYCNMIEPLLKDVAGKAEVIQSYKDVFEFMLRSLNSPNTTQELRRIEEGQKNFSNEINLWNPKSKSVCLLTFMYTLEPAFGAEL